MEWSHQKTIWFTSKEGKRIQYPFDKNGGDMWLIMISGDLFFILFIDTIFF